MDEHAKIIEEARKRVASGGKLNIAAFEARVRAAGGDTERALQQLARIESVQRARALLAGPPREPEPRPEPLRRPRALRTKPTITGNMDVRREGSGDSFVLAWEAEPKVVAWDVRVSERPDVRGDYVVRDEPGATTGRDAPARAPARPRPRRPACPAGDHLGPHARGLGRALAAAPKRVLDLTAGTIEARVGAVAGGQREDREDHDQGEECGHDQSLPGPVYQHKSWYR
jgi:hypothetical protein